METQDNDTQPAARVVIVATHFCDTGQFAGHYFVRMEGYVPAMLLVRLRTAASDNGVGGPVPGDGQEDCVGREMQWLTQRNCGGSVHGTPWGRLCGYHEQLMRTNNHYHPDATYPPNLVRPSTFDAAD
jgi:hypothetical protein